MTLSEVEEVSGYIGNFNVKVRQRARYVDEKECIACDECAQVCPVVVPDEFQQGFSSRKAAYIPYPQAVPSSYLIDSAWETIRLPAPSVWTPARSNV